MRAVMLEVSEELLASRRELGHDRWDEMWEGELHMVPPPHERHGRLEGELFMFFKLHWEALGRGRVYLETGVKRPGVPLQEVAGERVPSNYRTPDLSFLLPELYNRVQGGWIVGGPDAVLEIVSPGDESRDKLPFYLSVGVREAIFVDRDSCAVEVQRAGSRGFEIVAPESSGWVRSAVLGTELRPEPGRGILHLRRTDDTARALTFTG
jgi:Uma2 family endonuclease